VQQLTQTPQKQGWGVLFYILISCITEETQLITAVPMKVQTEQNKNTKSTPFQCQISSYVMASCIRTPYCRHSIFIKTESCLKCMPTLPAILLTMASLHRKQHVLKLSTFLNDEFMVHLTLSWPKLHLDNIKQKTDL
jgi:hypothetical protein